MEVSRIRAARPQSVEQEHGDRGHRVLRRRRVLHRQPPRLRGAAARPPAADRPAAPRGPPGRRLHRPRAADRLADHAGPRRLPGHVRSHLDHDRTGRVPGGGRVQRGRSRPSGDGTRPAAGARRAGRHALRPARRPQAPARAGRGRAPGPEHRLHRQRRHRARHSLPPPDAGQHGAVRLGQQAAPHPGRRDRPDQRHLRIDRAGQGPDQDAAGRGRRAGAAGPLGHLRRRSLGSRPGTGRPGRGQAARRQPGPRRGRQHRDARTRDPGLRSGRGNQLGSHRRALHPRP